MKGDEDACYAAGMNGWITKPISMSMLREQLAPYAVVKPESALASD